MASRFSLEAMLKMHDKITGPMKKAARNVVTCSRQMQNSLNRANSTVNRLNRGINKMAKSRVAQAGMAGMAVGAALVTRQYVEFDDAVTAAAAKFGDLNIASEEGQKTLEQLRQTARKVDADTQFNAAQAAQGLDYLAMAGFKTGQAMRLLPGVVNLATVANVDLARATDIASDAIGAFGMMTEDTAQLTKNFTRIQDVMAKTTTSTNTNIEDLFEAMKYGGPVFTAAGQSLETFNAIAGRMAANGFKGSMAGTALRAGMLRLADPPKEAARALSALNIQVSKAGKMRNMVDILADIEARTKGMGEQQRLATYSSIFGTRAVSAYASIMKEGVKQTKDLEKVLEAAGGSAEKSANIIRQSLGNKIKALTSAATEFGFKILSAFDGDAKNGIDSLVNAIRSFNVKPIVTGLKLVFWLLKAVYTVLSPFIPVIMGVVVATKLWILAQKGLIALRFAANLISWVKYIWMMRSAIMATAAITKIWTGIQWLLNAAMSANPIGLIIIGIIALIAYVAIAIKNWDKFGASMMVILGPIGMIISAFKTLYDSWSRIKAAFSSGGILAGLKAIGVALIDSMLYPLQQLLSIVQKIPGLGSLAQAGSEKIASVRDTLHGYASPETARSESTVTNKSQVDVNFNNTPAGTTVARSGRTAPGTTLNLGVN